MLEYYRGMNDKKRRLRRAAIPKTELANASLITKKVKSNNANEVSKLANAKKTIITTALSKYNRSVKEER